MAMSTARHTLATWKRKAEAFQGRHKRALEKTKEVLGEVVRTTEVTGSSFVGGLVCGHYGEDKKVLGVPVLLGTGGLLTLLGISGVTKELSPHVTALGTGQLASFSTIAGLKVGRNWKKGEHMAGEKAHGATMDDAELAGNIRRSR